MAIWLASTPADYLSTAEPKNSPRLFHRIERIQCLSAFCFSRSPGMARRYPCVASGSAGRWPVTRDPPRAYSTLCGRTFSKEARHVAWHAPLASIGVNPPCLPGRIGIRPLVIVGRSLGTIAVIGHVMLLPCRLVIAEPVRGMTLRCVVHVGARVERQVIPQLLLVHWSVLLGRVDQPLPQSVNAATQADEGPHAPSTHVRSLGMRLRCSAACVIDLSLTHRCQTRAQRGVRVNCRGMIIRRAGNAVSH